MAAPAPASDHVIIGSLPADMDEESLKTNFEAYGTIKWCRLFDSRNQGLKHALIEFGSVEEATWLVENLDGNVPLGLETEVTVKFKPAKGTGKGEAGFGKGDFGSRPAPFVAGAKGGFKGGFTPGAMKGGSMKGGPMMQSGITMTGEACGIQDLWKGLLRQKVLPGGTWQNDERTILFAGLPVDTTELDLMKIASPFGAIAPGGVRVTLNEDGTAKGNGMINYLQVESALECMNTLNNCTMPDGRWLRVKQWEDYGKGGGKGKKGDRAKHGKHGAITPASMEGVEG